MRQRTWCFFWNCFDLLSKKYVTRGHWAGRRTKIIRAIDVDEFGRCAGGKGWKRANRVTKVGRLRSVPKCRRINETSVKESTMSICWLSWWPRSSIKTVSSCCWYLLSYPDACRQVFIFEKIDYCLAKFVWNFKSVYSSVFFFFFYLLVIKTNNNTVLTIFTDAAGSFSRQLFEMLRSILKT